MGIFIIRMTKQSSKKYFWTNISFKNKQEKGIQKKHSIYNMNQLDDSARIHLQTSNLKQSNNLETREKTLLLAAN